MQPSQDVIQGALKLIGLPDEQCWTNVSDFIKWLTANLGVEIPTTITNVVVSNVQPLDSQRDVVWFRKSNSGSFMGLYLYGQGTWQQIFPVPGQIFRLFGNSTQVPPGFTLADTGAPGITMSIFNWLKKDWLSDPSGNFYIVFDVVFTGF